MKRIRLIALLLCTAFAGQVKAQLQATGLWRTHLSYRDAKICQATDDYVYAASFSGFFRVKRVLGEMQKLGKQDGFAGLEVTCLNYDSKSHCLFIGYADGNIDLLFQDQRIFNVPGFAQKALIGDKRILDVSFHEDFALVSTYFGLLVVDLVRHEIKDSYTAIGPLGSSMPVWSSVVYRDSLFVAGPEGLRSAPWVGNYNLNDYQNWSTIGQMTNPCDQLAANDDGLYLSSDSLIYRYQNGQMLILDNRRLPTARIQQGQNGMVVYRPGSITEYSAGSSKVEPVNIIVHGTQDPQGLYWFCTGIGPGVIKKSPNGEIAFMPDGPNNSTVFRMSQEGPYLFTGGGGVSSTFGNAFNDAGFYIYTPTGWVNNIASPLNQNLYDFTYPFYSNRRKRVFLGSHSYGMLVFNGLEIEQRVDQNNSPLSPISAGFLRVSGITEDRNDYLWFANFGADKALHCLDLSNNWHSFELSASGQVISDVKEVVADRFGHIWMIRQSGGLVVYDPGKDLNSLSDDRCLLIDTRHGLQSNEVLSLKADNLGYVWIGTNQGLNIFTGAQSIFENNQLDRFVIDQDGTLGYLMGEESIYDICIDGGGRKWFGTGNGLFLVDPYGQKVLRHFTQENSPLLSNRIVCLGQTDETGELFVGTDKGIISYRNDANQGSSEFQALKIYPNPVPPKYSGLVTIEGLSSNAEVKITDANGRLVYQTRANGGKATWDGNRLDGSRPNSGVYLVFALNSDGSETAMGKFIFMH